MRFDKLGRVVLVVVLVPLPLVWRNVLQGIGYSERRINKHNGEYLMCKIPAVVETLL